jgi:hypothetical protein
VETLINAKDAAKALVFLKDVEVMEKQKIQKYTMIFFLLSVGVLIILSWLWWTEKSFIMVALIELFLVALTADGLYQYRCKCKFIRENFG